MSETFKPYEPTPDYRDRARSIAREVREALAPIAARHGLTLDLGRTTYDLHGSVFAKVAFASPETAARNAAHAGLERDVIGRKFTARGDTWTITGVNPRRPKFPVIATRDSDGKKMLFTTTVTLALLPKETA